jgi:hypothetical protein
MWRLFFAQPDALFFSAPHKSLTVGRHGWGAGKNVFLFGSTLFHLLAREEVL